MSAHRRRTFRALTAVVLVATAVTTASGQQPPPTQQRPPTTTQAPVIPPQQAPAQAKPPSRHGSVFGIRTHVGVFMPLMPMVAVEPGRETNIELESGTAAGAELDLRFGGGVRLFAGMTHLRSRINHNSLMEAEGPSRPTSPVGIFIPTGGFLFEPPMGRNLRLSLRLGAGVKFYDFDLVETRETGVQDITGDVGFGFTASEGALTFVSQVRGLVSQFDPKYLPVRTVGESKQNQYDVVAQIGFRYGF